MRMAQCAFLVLVAGVCFALFLMYVPIAGARITPVTPATAPATAANTLPPATAPAHKPAIFLIGDSTIRNGSYDNGSAAGQFGWGHLLHYYFDTSRITVVNDAMGGTSSRSYQTSPTLWPIVLPKIMPGDYVFMAFGHNDSGNSIRGNGDETQPFTGRGATPGQTMHSFGWYMRQYIEQTKAKGATPIVLSLIPRNRWTGGKVNRNGNDYALWAKQAADQGYGVIQMCRTLEVVPHQTKSDFYKGFLTAYAKYLQKEKKKHEDFAKRFINPDSIDW